jgi:hypothetical protein
MSSIYNKTDNDLIIARINNLTPETKALWGKMTVDQMLYHCTVTTEVAFGTQNLKLHFLLKLLGRMLKKKVFYGGDMGKNSPTAKEFIITHHIEFEKAKSDFITQFSRFAVEGTSSIKVRNHPFWGKMTHEDWDALMWKHTNHHLEQFGV